MPDTKSTFEIIATTVQTLSIVAGIVISIMSFNAAQRKEAEARELETAKPFYTLRQNLYAEAVKSAGVLSNPEVHTKEEIAKSRIRFRELYVAELAMVEAPAVEGEMMALASIIDPELLNMTEAQKAAYDLAHALRNSFTHSWKIKDK
ncbi:hypothetical protein C8R32_106147 [Nitrosospira sp. Nsp5]|uniref:Uncharacterized protein n=1 Tax=Nitrosospira multiformis TaxID=1231 RepID=A0ABY0T9D6_9PROT|nr:MULTISPECIES: hypothetical protein [Nitrosospira]PTR08065.1 hypothetical protein C8R32_106147 [Nitrosospira sp. Nsp5]SDQ48083.1 hypothetical protein SAMN05216402_1021 [Nitrosospira multiformis]